jgi:hypothetical protein
MVLFDVPFAFVAAGLIGWRAQGRRFDLALACSALAVGVPGLAFLGSYPDWDWQYFVDASVFPAWFPAVFLGCVMLAGAAGHWVGAKWPKGTLISAVLLLIYTLVCTKRTLYVGDLASYEAGTAPLLPTEFLLFSGAWFSFAGAVLLGCWILASREGPMPKLLGKGKE